MKPLWSFTCYTAQEPECGRVPAVTIDDPLVVRDGDGDRDRLVELTATWLDGHYGADHHAVAQDLLDHLVADRLSLFCGGKLEKKLMGQYRHDQHDMESEC